MSRAWVLMTAMPPTVGHFNLMNFASFVGTERARVLVCTQPGEPFAVERWQAMNNASYRVNGADVLHLHRKLEQDPSAVGFWPMWQKILLDYGVKPGDYIVSSEPYGQTLADLTDTTFIPYDPARELHYTKATEIRKDPLSHWEDILPEFKKYLRTTITVFGAESTGKTTLSKDLARRTAGTWLFEWARPYLETVGPDINIDSMIAIWEGQRAAQKHIANTPDEPFVIQDTDLFSTVGYWEQPHWAKTLGPVPRNLVEDAISLKSDLYIITRSNIPFEQDPLRYGGDHRESPDEFWIGIAKHYDLPYVVLGEKTLFDRSRRALKLALDAAYSRTSTLAYDRGGF